MTTEKRSWDTMLEEAALTREDSKEGILLSADAFRLDVDRGGSGERGGGREGAEKRGTKRGSSVDEIRMNSSLTASHLEGEEGTEFVLQSLARPYNLRALSPADAASWQIAIRDAMDPPLWWKKGNFDVLEESIFTSFHNPAISILSYSCAMPVWCICRGHISHTPTGTEYKWTYGRSAHVRLRAGKLAMFSGSDTVFPVFVLAMSSVNETFTLTHDELRQCGAPMPRRGGDGLPISGGTEAICLHLSEEREEKRQGGNNDDEDSEVGATLVLSPRHINVMQRAINVHSSFKDHLDSHREFLGMNKEEGEQPDDD
uniref:Uncharacterized protein n=1 Tax=Palpitomonas bilix TaxID=652834 RepID=A0A7S3D310_9EUKA|mmetsp:Transcript_1811/g.3851  ORF Transcript_1811/g.3851 Transcript_1811/m.3851 type:complete len:315 (+) Transcript_1811:263-1207(+)